jgi:hypothetical protein
MDTAPKTAPEVFPRPPRAARPAPGEQSGTKRIRPLAGVRLGTDSHEFNLG